jgi:ATP-dependent exoDNAse (exonuclease V) beta subunit
MPLPAQLDIYKASAGSGKTFLLTLKYLQLVIERPSNYRHVLAVTFTNKATAE